MKCLSKKILCYILIGLLTFSVTSTVYYKSAHAMEWVGGALAFEEALKWLLAAIGITATAGMTDAYWDKYGDEFTDYAIENGATQTDVAEWQLKACQGIIDKGSVVWNKFKSWASELVNGNGGTSILPGSMSFDVVNYLNATYNFNIKSDKLSNVPVYAIAVSYRFNNTYPEVWLFTSNSDFYVSNYTSGWVQINPTSSAVWYYTEQTDLYDRPKYWSNISTSLQMQTSWIWYLSSNIGNLALVPNLSIIDFGETSSGDDNFQGLDNVNQNDLDVISSDGVDENDDEVTVPMPGVSDSDNEASKDAYQDIIDAINDGTITQEKGIEQIQEILKVITYDTVTDEVVPPQKNDDGTDKTKDDALKENKENIGFTLGGLEAVFPFCIPFDIYAFMTLLVADPVCPEFDFPIKSVNGQVEEIHIDLEPFEPVAVVVRYCFDFLFIIGLAMLTRSLIGGGSSD